MKLTKKRAIKLTLELWQWLYDNPDKGKSDWPEWEYNGGQYECLPTDCFCCEWVFRVTKTTCSACPLSPLWGISCTDLSEGNVYRLWGKATTQKDKKKYAKQIVDFCEKELQNKGGDNDTINL